MFFTKYLLNHYYLIFLRIEVGFQPTNRTYHELHDHAIDFAFLLSDGLPLGRFTTIFYPLCTRYENRTRILRMKILRPSH